MSIVLDGHEIDYTCQGGLWNGKVWEPCCRVYLNLHVKSFDNLSLFFTLTARSVKEHLHLFSRSSVHFNQRPCLTQ